MANQIDQHLHPTPAAQRQVVHKATILVVDARTLLRGCVVRTLKGEFPDLDIIEVDAPQACRELGGRLPRLVVLGLKPETLSDNALSRDIADLRGLFPATPIALICDDDETSLQQALRFGCNGYVPTSLPLDVAVAALRLVLVGGSYFPQPGRRNGALSLPLANGAATLPPAPAAVITLASTRHAAIDHAEPVDIRVELPSCEALPGFTPRELEVIQLLQRGRSNKIIASDLNLSENTVKVHVRHIMRKLKATNRTQAALRSQQVRPPLQRTG